MPRGFRRAARLWHRRHFSPTALQVQDRAHNALPGNRFRNRWLGASRCRFPLSCGPGALAPSPCGEVRHRPSPAMPVRVEVAVKPEPLCDPRRIPVRFRDPGPFQPIIYSGVGLVGATVAAPFRLLETLIPCGRQQPCPDPVLRGRVRSFRAVSAARRVWRALLPGKRA